MSKEMTSYHSDRDDYDLCAARVQPNLTWLKASQCKHKRGYGPEGAFCKQHDPEAVKARAEAKAEREAAKAADRKRMYLGLSGGSEAVSALRKIAAGHEDPKGLAERTLAEHFGWLE